MITTKQSKMADLGKQNALSSNDRTHININNAFICIKAGLIYMQGLKYMPGNAAQ